MTYLIDAWLERPQPCLRVLDRETGEVCVRLDEMALRELREQGELDFAELLCSDPGKLKELVRQLFLLGNAWALRSSSEA